MKPKKVTAKVKDNNAPLILYYNDEIIDKIKIDPIYKLQENNIKNINMQQHIDKHQNNIWCPPVNIAYKNISEIDSWFSIYESDTQNTKFVDCKYDIPKNDKVTYKAKKVTLHLTKQQKLIINSWLNAYLDMYNIAIKYIRNNIKLDRSVTNKYNLRKVLDLEKTKILNKFNDIQTKKSKNTKITVHDLDYAIFLACSNYESALTNLQNGNIKQFRIRYWKRNKPIKVMDLEKSDFKNGTIRGKVLGKVKSTYDGKNFNFNTIDCNCKLKRENGEYYLFVPETIDVEDIKDKKSKQISIDLGIRKFATCITENKIVKIGEESGDKIKKYLLRKDKILGNKNIDEKIKNLVTEMHWKTANYLTKNYETVLIGDLSAKRIVSKSGNLTKMTKRIAMHMGFYEFRRKLKYKCDKTNTKYGVIDEWMTSKMCSKCGNIDYNLGSNKIYECVECKIKMDRDINGARNIHIKARK
jgi:IS605 OrfB family transposase